MPRMPPANPPEERPEQINPGRILCFPAHDEADEIAAAMLAQLLEQAGCATISFPLGSSSENMLGVVEPSDNDIFCISAVPPFAFSHARTLNRQLRTKFPHSKILIGVWGFNGDIERAVQRFKPWPPDKFVVSLADAIAYLHAPAPVLNPKCRIRKWPKVRRSCSRSQDPTYIPTHQNPSASHCMARPFVALRANSTP